MLRVSFSSLKQRTEETMRTEHLHDLWSGPDNTRLTSKQFSFRLPVHIAAKIAALCDMYPTKNRTQIVADLLTGALDQLEKSLPEGLGHPVENQHDFEQIAAHLGEEYEPVYYLGGARGRFRDLANEHYEQLEKELGNESPGTLFEAMERCASQLKAKD
jgi:hypothetical protein